MGLRCAFQSKSNQATHLSDGAYRKDAIRVGRFVARNPTDGTDLHLDVTPERLSRWVNAYQQMQANGVKVDLTLDHKQGAEAKKGEVIGMQLDGDRLLFDAKPADESAEQLMKSCPEVSIEIEDVRDGEGRHYGEAISAISICRKPVVPGQQPFTKIAASRGGTPDVTIVYLSADLPGTSQNGNDDPSNKGTSMLTEEQIKTLRTNLGLKDDADADAILEASGQLKTSAEEAGEKVTALEDEKTTLSRQVTELQKGKAPEIDADALEMSADAIQARIATLSQDGYLTGDGAVKLSKLLVGEPGKYKAICLSRKAATHAGLPEPIAKSVLDIIEGERKQLAELLGEKTGGQKVSLSRQTPDSNDPDPWVKDLIDESNK